MTYVNLDKTKAFNELLKAEKKSVKDLLTKERIEASEIALGAGLKYNYAAMPVDSSVLSLLKDLSDEACLIGKYKEILKGSVMNTGEKRLVLHHLTRGNVLGVKVEADGEDKEAFYKNELEKIKEFSEDVHSGRIKGCTGKSFRTVCQIGIGGSDLGPRAIYLALKGYERKMDALFISNVDPDDAAEAIKGLDFESTLFILVSKSGTTEETLTNRDLVLETLRKSPVKGLNPKKHMVAVTSKTSPLAKDESLLRSFFIDDYIGGRYSSTSAVGGVVLSLAYGYSVFASILEGAHEEDVLSLNECPKKNGALMDALIGVYLRNVLGYPSSAILPYSQALSRFPAHLQQLDMESNGKHVNRFGEAIGYASGPLIFGEPGTNGQHSFYQLLHQGTDIVPLQFIGFKSSQYGMDIMNNGSTSQEKLNANLSAQIVAFALGKDDENPNKAFEGNRPSSLIYGDKLTPKALGALLAHFENKVMFQGFIWNLNSFDQEGVQLGKVLARKVLKGAVGDDILKAYADLLI